VSIVGPSKDRKKSEEMSGELRARRDVVIAQYLIDANIRLMLLAKVVFRNAGRARHNLRVKK
jgi:hypothetical protein